MTFCRFNREIIEYSFQILVTQTSKFFWNLVVL